MTQTGQKIGFYATTQSSAWKNSAGFTEAKIPRPQRGKHTHLSLPNPHEQYRTLASISPILRASIEYFAEPKPMPATTLRANMAGRKVHFEGSTQP